MSRHDGDGLYFPENGDIRWLEVNEVNCGVLVLKPEERFLDWVNFNDDEGVVRTLEEVSRYCTAYLMPEIEDDDEPRRLEQIYDLLFEVAEEDQEVVADDA